ncbi:MAG: ABC transporter substrate-binding protein, partial [Ilumatobacteraceae bacterium]
MNRHSKSFAAIATVGCLLLVSCRSDDKAATSTNAATTTVAAGGETTVATDAPESSTAATDAADTTTAATDAADTTTADTEAPAPEAWTVDTDKCADPEAATAPIEGEIKIGSAQPLSGTPAVAFSPVKEGMELYLKYANDNNLIPDHTVSIDIRDDQYDATQTPNVVSSLIDDNVAMFSGIIGSPNNLAVRDTLNEECIPQLLSLTGSPAWGDVENYPWLTGALVPYTIESKIYAKQMKDLGVKTVGLFSVNNEFGKVYVNGFKEAAAEAGIEIIEEQTIEQAETTPPTNQVGAIAAARPDAIMAIPLGAQCPTFTKELINAKAVAGDWNPIVFQTNTCGSRLLISLLAAGSGDGVYTSSNILDPNDPANDAAPGVKTFKDAYAAA